MIKVNIKTAKERKIWIDGFGNGFIAIGFAIISGMFFRNALRNFYNLESSLIIWIKIIGVGLGVLFAILTLLRLIKLNNVINKKWK